LKSIALAVRQPATNFTFMTHGRFLLTLAGLVALYVLFILWLWVGIVGVVAFASVVHVILHIAERSPDQHIPIRNREAEFDPVRHWRK